MYFQLFLTVFICITMWSLLRMVLHITVLRCNSLLKFLNSNISTFYSAGDLIIGGGWVMPISIQVAMSWWRCFLFDCLSRPMHEKWTWGCRWRLGCSWELFVEVCSTLGALQPWSLQWAWWCSYDHLGWSPSPSANLTWRVSRHARCCVVQVATPIDTWCCRPSP